MKTKAFVSGIRDAPEKEALWSPSAIRRFLITFVVLVIALLAPWPRWGRVFSAAFSGYANAVVGVFAIGGSNDPSFRTPTAAERLRPDVGEWTVLLSSRRAASAEGVTLDTRIIGYTPLAVFVALALATPVARRRKIKILLGGGGIMLARLAISIALPVARAMGGGSSWAFGPVAETFWLAIITPPAMSYVTAALAWWIPLALTTRRDRAAAAKTQEGQAASARTRAWKRDRGKTSGAGPRRRRGRD
jgi:hypothetical protein